jgi:RNA polymerase sigma factor (sigma-70 family)
MQFDLDASILSIADDDRDAFRNLYEELKDPIYFYALSIVKNEEEAKDIMQDTFLKIRVSARFYRAKSNPKAWIFRIVRNLAIDVFRDRRHITDVDDLEAIGDGEDFEEKVTGFSAANDLMTILKADEREIVSLRVNGGLSHHEISKTLAIPYEQVKWKYTYALIKLRNQLERDRKQKLEG